MKTEADSSPFVSFTCGDAPKLLHSSTCLPKARALTYRAASFHGAHIEDGALEESAKLGFNTVELQVEGHTLNEWERLRTSGQWAQTVKACRELNLDLALWTHELSCFDLKALGPVSVGNTKLGEALAERYRNVCRDWFPELKYVVLTVVETDINVTESALLRHLIEVIHREVEAAGKILIFRPFVWHPWEMAAVEPALKELPASVWIHTKYVPQDWHFRSIDHPLIGTFPDRKEVVEYGIAGEYMRERHLVSFVADDLFDRQQGWLAKGVDGVSVRLNRFTAGGGGSNGVYESLQECNLWALMPTVCGKQAGLREGLYAFAEARFGKRAAEAVTTALLTTGEVNREALCVERETFGDPRSEVLARNTLNLAQTVSRFHPDWMQGVSVPSDIDLDEAPFVPYDAGSDFAHRNPFYNNWAIWRWDERFKPAYEAIRRGEVEVIQRKEARYTEARDLAFSSIQTIENAAASFERVSDYDFLIWKLRENLWHLDAMCKAALAWLHAVRCLYTIDETEIQSHRTRVRELLADLETLHQQSLEELSEISWKGNTFAVRRGEYLDLETYITLFRKRWGITE